MSQMDISKKRAQLSAEKRALLEKRLRGAPVDVATAHGPCRRAAPGPAPLSFAQERLWLFEQLLPGTPVYNLPHAIQLSGWLDVGALQRSLDEIVRRHEVLRARLSVVDGRPVQTVNASAHLALPVVDLALPATPRAAEVRRLAAEQAGRPFDLGIGPLIRATLLMGDKEHVLLLTMHHIAADAWSLSVLARELVTLYDAYAAGRPSPLPELPIQYADFAVWQRAWLQAGRRDKLLAYWRQQLGGALPILDLPTDRPHPAVRSLKGAQRPFGLSRSLTQALKALCQQEGVTMFMLLLAAFKTLLYRYTGQTDILVGSPVASRNRAEIEGVIGAFVNTLVLRTNLAGNPTFRQLLKRVRVVALDAYAHQDLPFEMLVSELQPARDLSRTPLFQVMLGLQNSPTLGAVEVPGLRLHTLELEVETSQFDLTILLTEQAGVLGGRLEYNTDVFEPASIDRLARHLQTLLEGVAADPGQHLSGLPLLSHAEQQQLAAWNATLTTDPQMYFYQRFEEQARQTPDRIAGVYHDAHLTYQALNRRVNQLAHALRKRGGGPEQFVGVCLERSLELLVALLGCLKAGGVYVPLNPSHPSERLAFIVQETGMALILTQERLAGARVPATHAVSMIYLDTGWGPIGREAEQNPTWDVRHDNLAYVIYTSGSTGMPKGVMVTHRGLANLALVPSGAWGLGPDARVLQLAALSFDASILEVVLALSVGATLCLAAPEALLPGPALTHLLDEWAISDIVITPSALAVLPALPLPALQVMAIGGEACPAELAHAWVGNRRLINVYGPTEASVLTTVGAYEPATGRFPIGRPLPNVQAYVLDPHLQPVPVGSPGELAIGGLGLGRGYLNRPALTAAGFIPHPLSAAPGARLYKTGDLVRRLPDGQLDYVGRRDQQVKLRGFRIELGEIEAALHTHPAVREVAVLVREDPPGHKQLVAYLALKPGEDGGEHAMPDSLTLDVQREALRVHLKRTLPDYMLPSAFVFLESLPLTANGKADRRALAALAPVRSSHHLVAPRTPAEQVLASIWMQVLGREPVGVHDNLFELGGDSISAILIVTRANQAGLGLTISQLFQYQTIAELAAVATPPAQPDPPPGRHLWGDWDWQPIAQQLGPGVQIHDVYPLSPYQRWCLDNCLSAADPRLYLVVANALIQGMTLNRLAFEQAWQWLVNRHPPLASGLVWKGLPEPLQVVPHGAHAWVDFQDWRGLSPEEGAARAAALVQAEFARGLDLDRPPCMRVRLCQLREDAYAFIWTRTHLLTDGWSFPLLLKDLFNAYQAFCQGRQPDVPPTRPYRDYVAWIRQRDPAEAKAFWRGQLGDFTQPTFVAAAWAGHGRVPTGPVAMRSRRLCPATTGALEALAQGQQLTLYSLVAAAWAVVVSRHTGRQDVVFGQVDSGRTPDLAGIETMVGNTLSLSPLRVHVPACVPDLAWLKAFHARQRDLRRHVGVPLSDLERWSGLPEGQPLFDNYLVFERYPVDAGVWDKISRLDGLAPTLPITGVPLRVQVFPSTIGQGLGLEMVYYQACFDAATIDGLLQDLAATLEGWTRLARSETRGFCR